MVFIIFYRNYIDGQFITIPESPYINKILKHNPKLFNVSMREEKLKRILKIK